MKQTKHCVIIVNLPYYEVKLGPLELVHCDDNGWTAHLPGAL